MEELWIVHGSNSSRFARISWGDLSTTLAKHTELFRNRLVVVGGHLAAGDDVLFLWLSLLAFHRTAVVWPVTLPLQSPLAALVSGVVLRWALPERPVPEVQP